MKDELDRAPGQSAEMNMVNVTCLYLSESRSVLQFWKLAVSVAVRVPLGLRYVSSRRCSRQ